MNQNQLRKALENAGAAYSNTANYSKILDITPCIKISLDEIQNVDVVLKSWNEIMADSISLPWGSILFDIRDYPIPNYMTGKVEAQNMGVHVQAVSVVMQEVQIPFMLLQDFRSQQGTVLHKTYVMYGDQAGLHTMCSVEKLAAGCTCHKQNVFSNEPEYIMTIQDRTPCFNGDAGLALPDCSQFHADCASTISQKKEISDLAKLLLVYMNLPGNCLVKVTDISRKKAKASNVYHIVVDENQLTKLQAGDASAELKGNSFNDGSKLLMELEKSFFSPKFTPFRIGNKEYEVVRDKARESAESSPEGNEPSGAAVGSDLPEDAQRDATA